MRTVMTIRCPPALVEQLDAACRAAGLSRSAYVEQLLTHVLTQATDHDAHAEILARLDAILARLSPGPGPAPDPPASDPPTTMSAGQLRAGLTALQESDW